MKKYFLFFLLLLSSAAFAQSGKKNPPLPRFVKKDIARYKKENNPKQWPVITRYEYKGAYVYYFKMPCCDQQNLLYDSKGKLMCAPDGGITGKGDGRCDDFTATRKNPMQLWPDADAGN